MPSGMAPLYERTQLEIRPASIDQIATDRKGRLVQIDDDVLGIARELNEIDSHIRLRYSEKGEYWVVYYLPDEWEEGDGYLIFTAQDLDHRIVHKMRMIHKRCLEPGYSFAKELEDVEAKNKADQEHERKQRDGELHERLAHALRAQVGYDKRRIFVKEGV